MPQHRGGDVDAVTVPDDAGALAGTTSEADADRRAGMLSILSQLEYLHGEALRLNARMSAHLIGAAVQAVRRDLAEAQPET